MIQLAVFDLAGTTVVDNNFVAKSFQKAFQHHGLQLTEQTVNPLMGYHKPLAIQMVLEQMGEEADADLIDSIHTAFVEEMLDFYAFSPEVTPMLSAEDLFLFLKERGIKVALNTGFSRNIADVIVGRFQWQERGLVDAYIGSDEVPEGRPAPYMIQRLKEQLLLPDDADVMKVGDTVVDILEGRNAGCTYIVAVTTGAASEEELAQHHPTHLIHNLNQIITLVSERLQPAVQ